jgi:hypothetical protein
MGEFIAVTAVRGTDPAFVAQTIVRYAQESGVEADVVAEHGDDLVAVHPPEGGWTVVTWPMPVVASAVGGWLSRECGAQVSAIDVYDGAYWQHVAFYKGEVRDRFSSVPDYFATDEPTGQRLRREWAGDAAVLADFFDRPASAVGPYLVRADEAAGPAFPGDEFDLDDVWVFVDFWRRAGIAYPDPGVPLCHVRVDGEALPPEGPSSASRPPGLRAG